MNAALGVSTMMPSGTLGSWAMPSLRQLGADLGADALGGAQLGDAGDQREQDPHRAPRPTRGRARAAACGRCRSGAARADRPQPQRRVGAARHAHRRRQLVAAEIERAEGDRPAAHALERRDRVRVLLLLGRQRRALEVQELGAEQADRLGAEVDRDRDLLEHLDVGRQVDRACRRRSPTACRASPTAAARARAARRRALVAAQRLGVGVEDHLAAVAVDDHRHPRPDAVAEVLDAHDQRQPQRARHDRGVRRAAAPLGAEAGRLGAAQLRGVGGRQIVRRRRCCPWASPRPTTRPCPAGCAAGARRPWRRRCAARGSTGPRCDRTPTGSGRARGAPPTRRDVFSSRM